MRTEDRGIPVVQPSGNPTLPVGNVSLSPSSLARPIPRLIVFSIIAAAGTSWDLWSKWAVFDWLKYPGQQPVWNGPFLGILVEFDLATTFNHGALWGIGQGQTWLFATLSFFAIAAIAYFVWTRQAIASWWLTVASGLLLAGTLGNLYDRLGLHGMKDANGSAVYAVRDFLDFVFFGTFHWATFNFADTYLVTGAIMLVLQSFWTPLEETPAKSASSNSVGGPTVVNS